MSIQQTQARLLMAVWVIKRRYPNMPEDEVDKRACQIVPTSLSGVEIIDPKTFYLDTRSKAASKVRRWFKGGGKDLRPSTQEDKSVCVS